MFHKCISCEKIRISCHGPRFSDMSADDVRTFLKSLKKRYGWTNQYVADNSGVPLTTVNRFFADEGTDFRHDTARPIFRLFVGGGEEDPVCGEHLELHDRIRELTASNADLAAQISALKDSREAAINAAVDKAKAEDQRKIDFLKTELADAHAELKEDKAHYLSELGAVRTQCRLWRRISTACITGIIALLLTASILLLLDRGNPTWGIFWRDDKPSVFGDMTQPSTVEDLHYD